MHFPKEPRDNFESLGERSERFSNILNLGTFRQDLINPLLCFGLAAYVPKPACHHFRLPCFSLRTDNGVHCTNIHSVLEIFRLYAVSL